MLQLWLVWCIIQPGSLTEVSPWPYRFGLAAWSRQPRNRSWPRNRVCRTYAYCKGKRSFPSISSPLWHELFYNLKTRGVWTADLIGRFSWDGPYPKHEELSEYLRWLLTGGLCSFRLVDQRLVIVRVEIDNSIPRFEFEFRFLDFDDSP